MYLPCCGVGCMCAGGAASLMQQGFDEPRCAARTVEIEVRTLRFDVAQGATDEGAARPFGVRGFEQRQQLSLKLLAPEREQFDQDDARAHRCVSRKNHPL